MLNSGLGFSDEFEIEACNYSDKSGSKFMQQYREWTFAMRKEGSAFIRSVKDKVIKYSTFKFSFPLIRLNGNIKLIISGKSRRQVRCQIREFLFLQT